ncbi:hypothetical protein ACHWQZ_G015153 [Mnemiopsis leidyi]
MQDIRVLDDLIGLSLFGVCFAGTLGNLWMITTILRRDGDKILQSVLLSQLSVTDLVTCLISAPFSAYVLVNNRAELKLSLIPTNLLGFISTLMPLMSLYLILIICVARMIGIVKPLRYKSLITFKRLVVVCMALWFIASVYSALPFYFNKCYVYHSDTASLTFSTSHRFMGVSERYAMPLTTVPIVVIDIPLFLVVIFLSIILYNLRTKGIQKTNLRREASQTTLCIALLFAVCYVPGGLLRFLFLLKQIGIIPFAVYPHSKPRQTVFLYMFFLINTYTATVNSFANPILYYTRTYRRREKIYKKYEARKAKQEAATSITLAVTKRNVVTTTPRVGS